MHEAAAIKKSTKMTYLEEVFSKKFEVVQSVIARLPGVAPPIRRCAHDFYADTPFVDKMVLVKSPINFSFPNMRMYNSDSNNHMTRYK